MDTPRTNDENSAILRAAGLRWPEDVSAYLARRAVTYDPFVGAIGSTARVALRSASNAVLAEGAGASEEDAYLDALANLVLADELTSPLPPVIKPRTVELPADRGIVNTLVRTLEARRRHIREGFELPEFGRDDMARLSDIVRFIRTQLGLPLDQGEQPVLPGSSALQEGMVSLDYELARMIDQVIYDLGEHVAAGAAVRRGKHDEESRLDAFVDSLVDLLKQGPGTKGSTPVGQ